MKVYPVNTIESATLSSFQKSSYSNISDIYNRYLSYQVDFSNNDIQITGLWNELINVNTFIIANTNGQFARLVLNKGDEIVFQNDIELNSNINIIEVVENNKLSTKQIDNFILMVQGEELISIGYLYIGEVWVLPRFTIQPAKGIDLRNNAARTYSGQATGTPTEPLRIFSANFLRINNEEMKLIERYINGVQTVIPHVIDPYYEAHDEFEPMFATIEGSIEKEKNNEHGFYWDSKIKWMEAR